MQPLEEEGSFQNFKFTAYRLCYVGMRLALGLFFAGHGCRPFLCIDALPAVVICGSVDLRGVSKLLLLNPISSEICCLDTK